MSAGVSPTPTPRPEVPELRAYDQERFAEYHKRHGRKQFAPDFITRHQAMILDTTADHEERTFAVVHLMANGNLSDYAVDSLGNPLAQSDVARILGSDPRRVSESVQKLEAKSRLRREGRALYPVDDPIAYAEGRKDFHSCPDSSDIGRSKGEGFRRFLLIFDSQNPQHVQERAELAAQAEQIRAARQRLRQAELVAYKRWLLSETPRTNDVDGPLLPGQNVPGSLDEAPAAPRTNHGPILIEESKKYLEGSGPEEESVLEGGSSSSAFPETTTNPPPENTPDQMQISAAVQNYGVAEDELVEDLIERCRQQAPDCTTEEIIHYVQEKGEQIKRDRSIRSPIRFLVTAVPKCFASENYRQYRAQRLSLAAQTNFMSGSPPGRLNYYEEKGNQDFIRDLEREWDDGR